MAEIAESGGGGHGKGGKKRAKKQSTRVDMTPMVDLAFLLLTFFVLTSTFSKPKSMELSLPAEPPPGSPPPPEVKNGVTFLLTKDDKIFYYAGQFYAAGNEKGAPPTELKETNFSPEGLHKLLMEQNKWAVEEIKTLSEKNKNKQLADTAFKRMAVDATADNRAITVLIKTDDQATYKNAVDMLDELKICNVGKRVLGVEMMASEYALLQEKIK
ncbi:MAG: Biopolymer transport protein ExbD/TolR [Bacteroidota bacterium]|jgi:biopolymer transport protein ExbD|nr:Biopolymer transport protein ExbD/TolR [Bacteroidota bacterium]